MIELLQPHFPKLSQDQKDRFTALPKLYGEWNKKVNLISRKDIEHLALRHVLHSLAFAKVIHFQPGSHLLDLGTGGGFPGIPLAILFPKVHFTLIDGRGKKITAVKDIAQSLRLKNISAQHRRAEELKYAEFDFVLSRAVAPLPKLWSWSAPLLRKRQLNTLPNGLLALKGGNLQDEINALPQKRQVESFSIAEFFPQEWFNEKYLIHIY